MIKLPGAVLQTKEARHAYCDRNEVLAASDLGSPPFHLDNTGEIARDILRDEFGAGHLSITVMRGGAGQSFLDLLSAVRIGPEGVAQSHVIKALYPLGSPFKIAASAEWLCSIALSRSFRVI